MSSKTRSLTALAVLIALVPYALLVRRFAYINDDAFISFRYAKNLADGTGLRFNPGDHQPIEGYSNFLWVLFLTIPELFGADTVLWSMVGTIACGLALLLYVAWFAHRRWELGPFATGATVLFLGTMPSFALYSTSGLETMPFVLFLFATWERLFGDPERPRGWQAGMCAALTVLTRPDGFLFIISLLIAAGLTWLVYRKPALLKAALQTGAMLVLTVGLHTAFRWFYHGDYVANTVRVKGEFSLQTLQRGLDYFVSFFLNFPGLALILLFAPCLLVARARERSLPLVLSLLAFLAYLALVGADFMPMMRFGLNAMPLFALVFAGVLSVARLGSIGTFLWTAACVALCVPAAFDVYYAPHAWREHFNYTWGRPEYLTEHAAWLRQKDNADRWSIEGRALADLTVPGESLIRGPVGAVGYYTDLYLYDFFGLVDREVPRLETSGGKHTAGHNKRVSPDFFLKDHPTFRFLRIVPQEDDDALLLSIDPPAYAAGRMERVEAYPLSGEEQGQVLLLHRLVPLDQVFASLRTLAQAAQGVDFEDPQASTAQLEALLPQGHEVVQRLAQQLTELAPRRGQPQREVGDPIPSSGKLPFDVQVHVARGAMAKRWFRDGAVRLFVPLEGEPKVDGEPLGWRVFAPRRAHEPFIAGGTVGVITIQPARSLRAPAH